jgi:hypothetical protein
VISAVVFRAELMIDDAALTRLDGWLARNASHWSRRSYSKIVEVVDYWIQKLEPTAVRVARETEENRHIGISPLQSGMAEIWGDVRAPDAVAFDRRLDELAATVCPADPRTKVQRRADALSALAARATAMACACGSPDCPAAQQDATVGDVVIHVLRRVVCGGGAPADRYGETAAGGPPEGLCARAAVSAVAGVG